MSVSEAERHDLYDGLKEFLGDERANTLMTYLPTDEASSFATKEDIGKLIARVDGVESSLTAKIDGVNKRFDTLLITLIAGMTAIIGTMIAGAYFG